MRQDGTPPFVLGETFQGVDDDSNEVNSELLGMVYRLPVPNESATDGVLGRATERYVEAIILRNNTGGVLYGKRLGKLQDTAGHTMYQKVDGYADTLAEDGVVVIDSYLPSGGVADKKLFWGIINGPCIVKTPTVNNDFNGAISVRDPLVASTASTTGTSDAGRVSKVTHVAATSGNTTAILNVFNMNYGIVGYAMSARTTGNTDADLLINATLKSRMI